MMSAVPSELGISERTLEGIQLPADITDHPHIYQSDSWKFLGQNPADSRIYIYLTYFSEDPDRLPVEARFHLHIYGLHPVVKIWKQQLKLEINLSTTLDLDPDDHVDVYRSEDAADAACFDFEGQCAGFWNCVERDHGAFFLLLDMLAKTCKTYRVQKVEDVEVISEGFLGYSDYHRSFLALTTFGRMNKKGRLYKIIFSEEDSMFTFECIVSFKLTGPPLRFSFCPTSVALLQKGNLSFYSYIDGTFESFQVFADDQQLDSVNTSTSLRPMQFSGNSTFIFPQVVRPFGQRNIGNLVKISRSGCFYEAIALPIMCLPIGTFKEADGRSVKLYEKVKKRMGNDETEVEENRVVDTLEFGSTNQSFYLTIQRQVWKVKNIQSLQIDTFLVELPFPPNSLELLSVLAAKQVAKNSLELWKEDDAPQTKRISQVLRIPEKVVKKYFE